MEKPSYQFTATLAADLHPIPSGRGGAPARLQESWHLEDCIVLIVWAGITKMNHEARSRKWTAALDSSAEPPQQALQTVVSMAAVSE